MIWVWLLLQQVWTEKQWSPLCLCDVFQNIKDEFHDDGALTELASPSMDHRHQSAVQIIHVLGGKGLAIASCLVANLRHREKGMTGYWTEKAKEAELERRCPWLQGRTQQWTQGSPYLPWIVIYYQAVMYSSYLRHWVAETFGKTLNWLRP